LDVFATDMLALLPMGVFADKSTEVFAPVLLGIFQGSLERSYSRVLISTVCHYGVVTVKPWSLAYVTTLSCKSFKACSNVMVPALTWLISSP